MIWEKKGMLARRGVHLITSIFDPGVSGPGPSRHATHGRPAPPSPPIFPDLILRLPSFILSLPIPLFVPEIESLGARLAGRSRRGASSGNQDPQI